MNDGASRRAGRRARLAGNGNGDGGSPRSAAGFTIVETLIVVAVSGFMLISAVLLVTGQQQKVEFNQAAQDIRSVIEQTMSEVSSGYFNNPGNFRCSVSGGTVSITPGSPAVQGTNTGCIAMGKLMQFGVAGSGSQQQYITHVVAGLQDNDGTLATAKPQAVDLEEMRVAGRLRNGLQAVGMWYMSGSTRRDIGAVAFVSGLGTYGANGLVSGTQQISLVPVPDSGTVPNTSVSQVVTAVRTQLQTAPVNPDGGVFICFNSGGGRSALITIGAGGRTLSTKLDFKTTADCS